MRGKVERARSGRLPQGTGKGCYGYVYDAETGRRELDTYQAEVVRRIFEKYVETQSFSAVSSELNEAGISSFTGGRWYPLTIRRMLLNETYTGRMMYRRTKWVRERNGSTGAPTSRVVPRPAREWIEAEGSTPRIVDQALWGPAQEILNDPERSKRQPTPRYYPLRGRLKCGICGSAMIGQTLTVKNRPYRYYRCRHVYDKNTGRNCTAKYVRGKRLADAVWHEVKRVLSNPETVLKELERAANSAADESEVERLHDELALLSGRQKRLVRLYTTGEFDEDVLSQEAADIRRRRDMAATSLAKLESPPLSVGSLVDRDSLARVCAGVASWLDNADEPEKALALETLQVSVTATRDLATMTGVLPEEPPEFIEAEHTSRCSFNGDKPQPGLAIPFRVSITL